MNGVFLWNCKIPTLELSFEKCKFIFEVRNEPYDFIYLRKYKAIKSGTTEKKEKQISIQSYWILLLCMQATNSPL